ncbi:23443_t:CDS:2, partial [Dentiscutata erythropus]
KNRNAYKLDSLNRELETRSLTKREEFSGSVSFFHPDVGACGKKNTDHDFVCGISKERFGDSPDPNKNPNCGRQIKVTRGSKTVTVTVEDICTGCHKDDLNLSPDAFDQIADQSAGRVDCTWEFLS